jgi:hypothetical protein
LAAAVATNNIAVHFDAADRDVIWDAAWTRKRYLDRFDDVYYVDIPKPFGKMRHWFVRLRFGPIFFPALTQTFLTSPTGSNQTLTSDATWNNASNTVECIGAGGSGSFGSNASGVSESGGGGGEYQKITNFTFAVPGTTTATYQIGTGGAAQSSTAGANGSGNGIAGGDTWFNATAFPTVGTACGAHGGGAGVQNAVPTNGGAGGTGGYPNTAHANGGRGGNVTTSNTIASGGGGAGGPSGAGNTGLDLSSGATRPDGGSADAGSGGAAGVGAFATPGGNGGNGTELGDSVHGTGGGGGGLRANGNANQVGGSGGIYGGGGGASQNGATSGSSRRATSGAGGQGIIVLTWTPSVVDVLYAQIML